MALYKDNLRSFIEIRRKDRMPNVLVRELCGVKKRAYDKTDESVLLEFDHERMGKAEVLKGFTKESVWEDELKKKGELIT